MKKIIIENFNLSLLKQITNESLNTHSSLMFEIDNDKFKSLSISNTKTLMKMSYVDVNKLSNDGEVNVVEKFNMFVLKGTNFKKFLDLFINDNIKAEITLTTSTLNDLVVKTATTIKLFGKTKQNTKLEMLFNLSALEFMLTLEDDYDKIIKQLETTKPATNIVKDKYVEIVDIIKKLNTTIAGSDNSNFLNIQKQNSILSFYDDVFKIEFETNSGLDNDIFNFKILKNDLSILGKHEWLMFADDNDDTIIFKTEDNDLKIGIIITKVNNATTFNNDGDFEEDEFGINLMEYSEF